jgi:hypothetical protein
LDIRATTYDPYLLGSSGIGTRLCSQLRNWSFHHAPIARYGQTGVIVGPAVWHGTLQLEIRGEPTLLDETFVVARTANAGLDSSGWTAQEKAVVKELRWWSLKDLRETSDIIVPQLLTALIEPIMDGRYPTSPSEISL